MNFESKKPLSAGEADAFINGLWGEDRQTHRMDAEHDGYRRILADLHAGKISPDESKLAAQRLSASRQEGAVTDFEDNN